METSTFTVTPQKCMCLCSDYIKSPYDVKCDVSIPILHHHCMCRITTINHAAWQQTWVLLASHCTVKSYPCYSPQEYLHVTGWISTSLQGLLSFMLICDRTLSPDYFGIICIAQHCWKKPPITVRPAVNLFTWITPFVASGPD